MISKERSKGTQRAFFKNFLLSHPCWSFFLLLVMRYFFILLLPITNDEAYYWTWGKDLQLSYVDHPPGVAVLAYLEGLVPLWKLSPALGMRWLVPILHGISSYLLFSLGKFFHCDQDKFKTRVFILTQFIPGFSFLGVVLLPDVGLIFSLSLALYIASMVHFDKKFSPFRGLLLGFFLGLTLLFKYHGFPISCGLLVGLLVFYRKEKNIISFLGLSFLMMILTFSPVLFWNYENQWVSFLFQTKHGFAAPEFNLLYSSRFILGCCIFVTPFVFYHFLKSFLSLFKFKTLSPFEKIILLTTLPLFLLFLVNSFFKQMLPHWVLPCLWPMILLLARKPLRNIFYLKNTLFIFHLFLFGSLFALNQQSVQNFLAVRSDEVKELFLWKKVSLFLEGRDFFNSGLDDKKEHCPKEPIVIAFNWFRAAQLSTYLPQNVRVFCLDFFKPNFYYYRDKDLYAHLNGCSVTMIGYADNFKNVEPYFQEVSSFNFTEPSDVTDPLWIKQGIINGLDPKTIFKF